MESPNQIQGSASHAPTRARLFLHPLFITGLVLKLAASCTLGSHFIRDLTSPFVQWVVQNPGADPWTAFLNMNNLKAFPYHLGMLFSLLPGRLLGMLLPDPGWQVTTWVDLLTLRIPLLLADVAILWGVRQLTRMSPRRALWLYWLNPMVFYINYVHGQLDIIPVFLVFAAVFFLQKPRPTLSAAAFGAGLATKSTALLLLPVFVIYLARAKGWSAALRFAGVSLGIAALAILPLTSSSGYQVLVLGAQEQLWLFKYALTLPVIGVKVYLAILGLLLLYWKMLSHRKINTDLLISYLGLAMMMVLVLVPPMPGWFMWLIPTLVHLNRQGNRWKTLLLLDGSFLVWFLIFAPTADLFDCVTTLGLGREGPVVLLPETGLLSHLAGLSMTALLGSLLYSSWELWSRGIASNRIYQPRTPVIVGIAGDSGAGKDTLCNLITRILGNDRVLQLDGDDYHRWERHDPRYGRFSHLHVASNHLHQQGTDVATLARGRAISRGRYDHSAGRFTRPSRREPREFILISGLHSFLLGRTRRQMDLKLYLDPDEDLRLHWKTVRDLEERGSTRADVEAQVHARRTDSRRFIAPQKDWADLAICFQLKQGHTIEDYIEAGEEALELTLRSGDTYDWNTPLGVLGQWPELSLEVSLSQEGDQSLIKVSGRIPGTVISSAADTIIPNLEELSPPDRRWEEGLLGVVQLFLVYFISQARRHPDWSNPAGDLSEGE